jgi:predicted methyltransferase
MDHVGESRFDNQRLHRIEPRTVRRLLRDAGFVVVAESGLFANPEDDHSKMVYDDSIYRRTDRLLYKAMVAD